MAGITGSQDYWIVGSRFYFEPNLAGSTTRSGDMIDLGTVDTVSPQISTNIAELKDSESGVIILLDQGLVSIDETYSISVKNFNFRNLQILFAGKPQAETQAASLVPAPITLSSEELSRTPSGPSGNVIKPTGGYLLLQLRSSTGEPLRNFTTASTLTFTANTGVSGVSIAMVKDTNWVWWDAPKGIIRIIVMSGAGYSGTTVTGGVITTYPATGYTMTFSAATGLGYSGNRVIYPQSATLSDLTGNAHIYWSRNNGADVSARTFACQIQPAGSSLTSDDYSSWTLTVTALATGTSTEIAGRYTNIKWNNTTTGDSVGLLPSGDPAYNENFFGTGGGGTGTDFNKNPDNFGVGESLGGKLS
jgi:hypothetical protein